MLVADLGPDDRGLRAKYELRLFSIVRAPGHDGKPSQTKGNPMPPRNDTENSAILGEANQASPAPPSPWQMASTLAALADRYKAGSHEQRTISDAAELLRALNSRLHDATERAELAEDRAERLRGKIQLAVLALHAIPE